MQKNPGIQASDILLAVTTLSFDMSVVELFLPLISGAKIILASQDEVTDGRELTRLLENNPVSILQGTPTTWQLLLDAGWQGKKGLTAFCGGEAMSSELVTALLERCDHVWDLYGPTETTVYSTWQRLDNAKQIRIGKPLSNTQVYVLDVHLEPVPVGVIGELFIGGVGVALEYLNRPELNAERFVENPFYDPFADFLNPRLYRTGDLVRWDHDGRLDYLGRRDQQIKIRGFRVELGEIEAVLGKHPAVKQAVALVREDSRGDVRLVTYIVVHPDHSTTGTEIRRHLRQHLPDYMIPQHVVEIPELPRTSNGKVDRKRLPNPHANPSHPVEHLPPCTAAERYLAQLWQEFLGGTPVGRQDNFIQRGGHSLLAFRVLTRIEKETGTRLPPRSLILGTLEQIAAQLPQNFSLENSTEDGLSKQNRGLLGKLRDWFGSR